jgi:hypothetical protein
MTSSSFPCLRPAITTPSAPALTHTRAIAWESQSCPGKISSYTYCSNTCTTTSDHNDLAAGLHVFVLGLQVVWDSPVDLLGQLEGQGVGQAWVGSVEGHGCREVVCGMLVVSFDCGWDD